jgi:hypothetical protein
MNECPNLSSWKQMVRGLAVAAGHRQITKSKRSHATYIQIGNISCQNYFLI